MKLCPYGKTQRRIDVRDICRKVQLTGVGPGQWEYSGNWLMLYDETRYFWAICCAVRVFGEGVDLTAAREAVEDLEMVGLNTSSFRLFKGTLAGLKAATHASNPAARKAAELALLNLSAVVRSCSPYS